MWNVLTLNFTEEIKTLMEYISFQLDQYIIKQNAFKVLLSAIQMIYEHHNQIKTSKPND